MLPYSTRSPWLSVQSAEKLVPWIPPSVDPCREVANKLYGQVALADNKPLLPSKMDAELPFQGRSTKMAPALCSVALWSFAAVSSPAESQTFASHPYARRSSLCSSSFNSSSLSMKYLTTGDLPGKLNKLDCCYKSRMAPAGFLHLSDAARFFRSIGDGTKQMARNVPGPCTQERKARSSQWA